MRMNRQTASANFSAQNSSPTIAGPWLTFARAAWLLITGAGVVIFAIGVPLLFAQMATICSGSDCLRNQLRPEALPAMTEIGLTLSAYAVLQLAPTILFAVVSVVMGILIFWRRSHELMAYVSSLWLVTFGLTLFEEEVRATGAAYPALEPAALLLIRLGGVILLPLFFFIFPNGRFAPRWTKWVWLIISGLFVSLDMAADIMPGFDATYDAFSGYLWITMVLGSIAVQFYRYRYLSTANERLQTKWVIFAFLVIVAVFVTLLLVYPRFLDFTVQQGDNAMRNAIGTAVAALPFLMIPLGIGISILRHRLFDIDVIIRRTVQYSLVTALLAAVYFGSITVIQGSVTAVTGTQSPIAIVLSTLLVAALFNPVRRRIQTAVDRRFYRKKYDSQQVLASFAQTARDEVEIDTLQAELLQVVQETMQPEKISIWLQEK
jgi:hypothetical protein